MATPDKAWLQKCVKGDEEACRELFRRYERYVYALCLGFAQDREEARDLCQESFIRIYRGLKGFDSSRPLKPWIRTVTINTCISCGRQREPASRSLESCSTGDVSAGYGFASSPASTSRDRSDPERQMELKEIGERLKKALRSLRPEERVCLVLRHQEDLGYSQIAAITGFPLGTVKTHLYRARQALRELLSDFDGGLE